MQNYDDSRKIHDKSGRLESEHYFLNKQLHRLDGPASIYYFASGKISAEYYYLNGNQHRTDGPAYISYNEFNGRLQDQMYWFNQLYISSEYIRAMNASGDKTETLMRILKTCPNKIRHTLAQFLSSMFKDDIDKTVRNNLELFL